MSDDLSRWLWFSSFCLCALLSTLCFWQGKFKEYLFFCLWILESTVGMCVLYGASQISAHIYGVTYVSLNVIDECLQILVVYSFARQALRYEGHWLPKSKRRLVSATVVSAASAVLVGAYAEIASAASVDRILIRLNLPGAVFVCVLMLQLLWMSFTSGFVGTLFQRRLFTGFVLWTFAGCLSDTLQVYSSTLSYINQIEVLLMVFAEVLFCYWIIVLLLPVPKKSEGSSKHDLSGFAANQH